MKIKHNFWLPSPSNVFIWLNTIFLLYGLFGLNWKPEIILIVYFMETIIIGIIHVAKLLTVYKFGVTQNDPARIIKPGTIEGFTAIPFFIFHYFFFIFVQSIFIFFFMRDLASGMRNEFNVFQNYSLLLSQPDVLIAFIGLSVSHAAYALKNFFLPQRYNTTTIEKLFLQPYLRIFIQQLVTILSGLFIIFTGGPMVSALLLIALRLIVDLYLSAAAQSKALREVLVHKLAKGQKPEDANNTKEVFNAFLEP